MFPGAIRFLYELRGDQLLGFISNILRFFGYVSSLIQFSHCFGEIPGFTGLAPPLGKFSRGGMLSCFGAFRRAVLPSVL